MDFKSIITELSDTSNKIFNSKEIMDDSFIANSLKDYFSVNSSNILDKLLCLTLLIELFVLLPNKSSLKYIARIYNDIKQLSIKNKELSSYISLTRLNNNALDKLSCDWCSIVNGVLHYINDTIDNGIKLSDKRLLEWRFDSYSYNLKFKAMRLLPKSVVRVLYDKKYIASCKQKYAKQINKYFTDISKNQKKHILKSIEQFVITKHLVECIEQRWCPFKHLQKLAYKPKKHQVLDWKNKEHLAAAAELLKKHGNISCNECTKIIGNLNSNSNKKNQEKELDSPFNAYLSYLYSL